MVFTIMSLERSLLRRDKQLSDSNVAAKLKLSIATGLIRFSHSFFFIANQIIYKMAPETLELLNNYKSYRCSKLIPYVRSVGNISMKFLSCNSAILYYHLKLKKKLTSNLLRTESPKMMYR
jgi:hypothetical protein